MLPGFRTDAEQLTLLRVDKRIRASPDASRLPSIEAAAVSLLDTNVVSELLRPSPEPTVEARFRTRSGVRMTMRALLAIRYRRQNCCSGDHPIRGPHLEDTDMPADQGQPGLAIHRDMTQRLAEQAAERHVVVFLDEPVSVPVPQVGRTVTVRRSRDKFDVDSFTMATTLPQQKREGQPPVHFANIAGQQKTALGCYGTA